MTRHPTKTVSLTCLASDYGAKRLYEALQMSIARYQHPSASQEHLNYTAPKVAVPFLAVPVFHKIKFWNQDPYHRPDCSDVLDVAHVRPRQKGKRGWVQERFDTVLVNPDEVLNDVSSIRGLSSCVQTCCKVSLIATGNSRLLRRPGPGGFPISERRFTPPRL